MKLVTILAMSVLLLAAPALAHDGVNDKKQEEGKRRGYILKVGEGEVLGADIIKASPKSGTQGGVMIVQAMTDGFSTGLHEHLEADEFFYVISGRGRARLGREDHPIEAGDVIFVPAGEDHKIFVGEEGPLEILFFLDKPGLDEEFRVWHRRFSDENQPVTLEEINAIARKYGTVYKSID